MSPGAVSISYDNDDMDEEETATEVEVAEKTVKFKISTETAIPGRNTCPSKPLKTEGLFLPMSY